MRRSVRAVGAAIDAVRRRMPARDRGSLVIVAYHRIDDGGGGLSVSRDEFLGQLDWIEATRFPVVDLSDPSSRGTGTRLALTFDDGYRSVADTAWPALRERGWPATLYAVSRTLDDADPFAWDAAADSSVAALVDRPLLRELADDGMAIGSHTRSHRYLPMLSPPEAARELDDSRRELEDAIGRPVLSLSYPMGGWNRTIRNLAGRAGYRTAVTMERGRNVAGSDPLALRRQPTDHDITTFARSVSGCFDFLRPIDRMRARRYAAVEPHRAA
jgi:peptidoglycan/xylan/chitin deacetylase (PgdA/CDA1 family)